MHRPVAPRDTTCSTAANGRVLSSPAINAGTEVPHFTIDASMLTRLHLRALRDAASGRSVAIETNGSCQRSGSLGLRYAERDPLLCVSHADALKRKYAVLRKLAKSREQREFTRASANATNFLST